MQSNFQSLQRETGIGTDKSAVMKPQNIDLFSTDISLSL